MSDKETITDDGRRRRWGAGTFRQLAGTSASHPAASSVSGIHPALMNSEFFLNSASTDVL
jgi:hypothetical protein